MHPQIRQPEPGDCPICGMDLIPLEESSSNDPLVLEMTREAVKLANIQTTTVGGSMNGTGRTIRLSGKVQADERRVASQVAHVPGRIEKLFVTFTGEEVRKGQKLATIYSPELITAQRELLEAVKLQAVNPGLLTAARNKMKYWKIDEATINDIENSGEIKESFTLQAGESGVVTNRKVAVGDYVQQGEPLFELINLNTVWVLFDAYEGDLPHISKGDRIVFSTPSLPGRNFTARVTFIDPFIDAERRVASVRTEMANPGRQLKPEMLVYGNLNDQTGTSAALSVPKSAVLWTGKRSVVYVKIPDAGIPSFQFREIELGESLGDHYQVLNGLELGEEVVTNGNFAIDAAAQLNNQASMMNKDVLIEGEEQTAQLPDYKESSPVAFRKQMEEMVESYLLLKDALVASNSESAGKEVGQMLEALSAVNMSLLEGDAHNYWMEQHNAIQAHGKKIQELGELEEQRKQFDFLSQALIRTLQVFGVADDTFYVQHCPMAFDDEGADWISDVEEIRNPYFGDQMLTCGIVEDTIKN